MDELLADFLAEANDMLAQLDPALLVLERTPGDAATVSLVFRLVHTIKGTCGFLGLPRLERVAHAAEDVLARVRDGALTPDAAVLDGIFAATGVFRGIVDGLAATGAEPPGQDDGLVARLRAIAAGEAAPEISRPPPQLVAEAESPAAAPAGPESHTIRVPVALLDMLMGLAGELVLTRNQLMRQAGPEEDHALSASLQRLSQITSELQEGVTKTRMQPVGNAWNKLPRLVRDLGRDLGKPLLLVTEGADTELDRHVLEQIVDPLTHIVRNCADHGIEPAADRAAAGKPSAGTIAVRAVHTGGRVIVTVTDDGGGLAIERIRGKAVAQGLATEAEAAAMTDARIARFILEPGFSTADAITAVSGRGVGMDVVRTNIERIGGSVEIESERGRGTTFRISLPLTLAIVSAMIVEAAGMRFALPQTNVVELVRVAAASDGAASIERIGRTCLLRLRETLLPLIGLPALLRVADGNPSDCAPGQVVAVLQVGAERFGLVVDRVFDMEEIVVKPVSRLLRGLGVYGGTTILGDGSVVMILDAGGIARSQAMEAGRRAGEARAVPEEAPVRAAAAAAKLLLVEAGQGAPLAIPLHYVARVETVPPDAIEGPPGRLLAKHHGRLLPLIDLGCVLDGPALPRPVVVVSEGGRQAGLIVDAILDVLEAAVVPAPVRNEPGVLATALLADRATDVIDVPFWLAGSITAEREAMPPALNDDEAAPRWAA